MKKIITNLFVILMLLCTYATAQQCSDMPTKEKLKNAAKFDEYLDTKLHFTSEQKNFIRQNRQQYRRDVGKILKQMQTLHDEIRDVYLLGLPKYQADFRTAGKKAQLVVLKQNAKWVRDERRKAFESILDKEQKAIFDELKKEFANKNKDCNKI